MNENGGNNMQLIVSCLIVSVLLGGGYFLAASVLIDGMLLSVLLYQIIKKQKITLAIDLNFTALGILAIAYLASALWAIDSGMALFGFVKFLPLFLFYIYISGYEEKREDVISMLPLIGCLMTLISISLIWVPALKKWVTVAGRLAGFFQYPNTYAIFMLVCLIIVIYRLERKEKLWVDLVYLSSALLGIYMSGSRTVFILTGGVFIWILLSKKELRKILSIIAAIGSIVIVGSLLLGNSSNISRLTAISLNETTFLGRILYVKDAIPVVIKHPFGLGYYGYHFIQQSIQTGVYSVVNVHNEFLQIMLDVGIIPAMLVGWMVVCSIISGRTNMRNRLILIVMVLHSLLDYDFQFLLMGLVLILFLDIRNVKLCKVPILTRSVLVAVGAGAIVFSIVVGISDICHLAGKHETALKVYQGNTIAELKVLTKAGTAEEMRNVADSLIARNKYLSVAYSAKARVAFAEGNIGAFIENKQWAIKLAPYQYEEYVDYLEILAYSEGRYLESGSIEDAKICVQRAVEVPEMLNKVKENTSSIAWKIRDKPQLTLSEESINLIEEMKKKLKEENL